MGLWPARRARPAPRDRRNLAERAGVAYELRMRHAVALGIAALALASACLNFGQESAGGGTAAGAPVPVPVPPSPGAPACLDDASAFCSDAAEVAAYTTCVLTQCQAGYATCFGSSYASGVFDGDCKDYGACTSACATCDEACLAKCATSAKSGACDLCVAQQIRACANIEIATRVCPRPCTGATGLVDAGADAEAPDAGGLSTGACMNLALCCNMLPPEATGACQIAWAETNDVDSACANVLATYKASGKCP